MKKYNIVQELEEEIEKFREGVSFSGDASDIVFIGENIAKLKTAKNLIENVDFLETEDKES